jgi:hypothetical protein
MLTLQHPHKSFARHVSNPKSQPMVGPYKDIVFAQPLVSCQRRLVFLCPSSQVKHDHRTFTSTPRAPRTRAFVHTSIIPTALSSVVSTKHACGRLENRGAIIDGDGLYGIRPTDESFPSAIRSPRERHSPFKIQTKRRLLNNNTF